MIGGLAVPLAALHVRFVGPLGLARGIDRSGQPEKADGRGERPCQKFSPLSHCSSLLKTQHSLSPKPLCHARHASNRYPFRELPGLNLHWSSYECVFPQEQSEGQYGCASLKCI